MAVAGKSIRGGHERRKLMQKTCLREETASRHRRPRMRASSLERHSGVLMPRISTFDECACIFEMRARDARFAPQWPCKADTCLEHSRRKETTEGAGTWFLRIHASSKQSDVVLKRPYAIEKQRNRNVLSFGRRLISLATTAALMPIAEFYYLSDFFH
jgi:hypothetical protein